MFSEPSPPRYLPQHPLPPYTYVPGKSPHPLSDAAGHSYGKHPPPSPPLDETNWSQHEAYLGGVDLFNHGYYWEAHEAWESAWHAVGRRGAIADLLKGLIHLAAAGVKLREDRPTGVVSHLQKASALFEKTAAAAGDRSLGLSLSELLQTTREAARQPPPICGDPPTVVRPLFAFVIRPGDAA
jgi:uncharacterized protein